MTPRDNLETRLVLYRLLAALYRYPLTQEKLSTLSDMQSEGDFPLSGALQDLQSASASLDEERMERLNVEMTRLMEGPGVTPAVPYASYYLNGKQLMGVAAQAAHRLYLEHGVEPELGSIPPDHIALELGFMAVLAERALTDIQPADALETSLLFLGEHLKPWLSLFCAALETSANEPCFRALAIFTRKFVTEDETWLRESLLEIVS